MVRPKTLTPAAVAALIALSKTVIQKLQSKSKAR
jgi:hypothetical protein